MLQEETPASDADVEEMTTPVPVVKDEQFESEGGLSKQVGDTQSQYDDTGSMVDAASGKCTYDLFMNCGVML